LVRNGMRWNRLASILREALRGKYVEKRGPDLASGPNL